MCCKPMHNKGPTVFFPLCLSLFHLICHLIMPRLLYVDKENSLTHAHPPVSHIVLILFFDSCPPQTSHKKTANNHNKQQHVEIKTPSPRPPLKRTTALSFRHGMPDA